MSIAENPAFRLRGCHLEFTLTRLDDMGVSEGGPKIAITLGEQIVITRRSIGRNPTSQDLAELEGLGRAMTAFLEERGYTIA